jgi:hypothetical protein
MSCIGTVFWNILLKESWKEVTEGRGRKCKQLLNGIMETTGYWKSKDEALDRTLWRTRFGIGYGLLVIQTAEWMNEWMNELMNEWAARGLPSTPLVCPNNLSCVGWHTLHIHSLMLITWQCKQLRQLYYTRHSGSINVIHFITYRYISGWTRHSAATHHGVPTKNKSLTEMGEEEKEQRQEVRDQIRSDQIRSAFLFLF